jgi:hypothetical protein
MSTDSFPLRVRPDQRKRFGRISGGLILVLAVIAGGLGMANAAQGPRLISAEVNPNALTTRDGQRLILHLNQPLSDSSPVRVSISPDAPIEATVDQNTVTIRFTRMLDYNTTYNASVEAHSAATGFAGRIEYTFATGDVDVYSLLRDTRHDANSQDPPDKILLNTLSGIAAQEVAFESPRIQSYVVLRDQLGVIALDPNDVPSLIVTSPIAGTQIDIDLAGARTIEELHAADTGDLFGYILDDGSGDKNGLRNRLFLYDLSASSGIPAAVTGFAQKPLAVMDWMFVPGTTSVVVQDEDLQLYLIDGLEGGDPTPLGGHAEMRGFIPGTLKLVVADPESGSVIDLSAGTTTTLNLPIPQTMPDYYPGKLELLSADSYVLLNSTYTPGAPSASVLVLTDPDGSRELFRTTSAGSRVRNFCLSPNGEFLAVEVISGEGVPDEYPVESGYSATSIFFVRVDDGTSNRGVNGFLPNWCSSNN